MTAATSFRQLLGFAFPFAAKHDFAITQERSELLADIINRPTDYIQRIGEQLSFVPTGGQRWIRSLQIKLPGSGDQSWWIIPLGQFERKRFADFEVTDAEGRRVNLLTRRQHGDALTEVITAKYLSWLTPVQRQALQKQASSLADNRELRQLAFRHFTALSSSADANADNLLAALLKKYRALLISVKVCRKRQDVLVKRLRAEFIRNLQTTPYLCWVNAAPGEVVNLRASYTAADENHELRLGRFGEIFRSISSGLWPVREASRETRSNWYRQYGLAPIDYKSEFPRGNGASSYYFTLEPPPQTICPYLDWETDNSFNDDAEVDSAFPAAHIHADDEPGEDSSTSGTIRAYLRCVPHRQKQMLGATALNVVVVALLARGRFPDGFGPLQGLLLAIPSIVIALLTQRQRHYYSYVMRRQRVLFWIFLGICVGFLVTVAFNEHNGHLGDRVNGWLTVVAWTMGIVSVGMFVWQSLLGHGYDRMIRYLTERKWEVDHDEQIAHLGRIGQALRTRANRTRRWYWRTRFPWRRQAIKVKFKWECYADAVTQYCCWIWRLAILAMVATALLLQHFWDPERGQSASVPNERTVLARSVETGKTSVSRLP